MENDFKQLISKLNDSVLIAKLLQGIHISWEDSIQRDQNQIHLGPKREELTKVIPMTIVYSIICFTGIIGNVCTCIVIAKAKYMRTTTNIYLFNLAVADLLVLILGLPFEIYTFWSAYPWIFGEAFCYLRNMASETTTCASVLTITAFTVERYMAFCHPTKAPSISNLTRVTKILVIIWFLSGLLALPLAVQFGIVYVKDEKNKSIKESAQCTLKQIDHSSPLFGISAFLFFILPMTIISVMYVCIALAIKRSTLQISLSDRSVNRKGYPNCFPGDRQSQARKAVVKMLVAVVVAFFICWAPFHIQRLMVFYVKEWTQRLRQVERIVFYISGILYYFSATINPVLYNIMSVKFRQAFKMTLLNLCAKNTQRNRAFMLYRNTLKDRKHSFDIVNKTKKCFVPPRQCEPPCICPVPSSGNSHSRYHKSNMMPLSPVNDERN